MRPSTPDGGRATGAGQRRSGCQSFLCIWTGSLGCPLHQVPGGLEWGRPLTWICLPQITLGYTGQAGWWVAPWWLRIACLGRVHQVPRQRRVLYCESSGGVLLWCGRGWGQAVITARTDWEGVIVKTLSRTCVKADPWAIPACRARITLVKFTLCQMEFEFPLFRNTTLTPDQTPLSIWRPEAPWRRWPWRCWLWFNALISLCYGKQIAVTEARAKEDSASAHGFSGSAFSDEIMLNDVEQLKHLFPYDLGFGRERLCMALTSPYLCPIKDLEKYAHQNQRIRR